MSETERGTSDYIPESTVRQTAPSPVVKTLVEPGQRLDDFDLLAKVGEGSFAQVYLARQVSMQRLVALKVSADQGAEPQTLAQLDHPHIVRVYDQRLLPDRGLRLLYMPYLAGGTLNNVVKLVKSTPVPERNGKLLLKAVDAALETRGVMPPTDSLTRSKLADLTWPETLCWLGARLAEALAYAHKQGVLHRDLKPANVLLGSDASPRLADFNVSSSEVEGEAVFGGSLAYMSPEQLEAFDHTRTIESLDGRSDIYSLAVTLWELLTGERPFTKSEPHAGEMPNIGFMLCERRGGLDRSPAFKLLPGMLDVLRKCLRPNPEDRFANASELARALELCCKPRSRELLVPSPGWRTWVQRHPIVVLYTVTLLPNIVASLFSIKYNGNAIVNKHPALEETFKLLQLIINGIFFPLCMYLFGYFIWPVVRGLRPGGVAGDLKFLRRRCLRLGQISVHVCLWAWVAAGIIFPLSMHFAVHELPASFHLHFIASQTLCGLIAVTYPQFGVTFFALRCFYPKFVTNATLSAEDHAQLRHLEKAQGLYLVLAALIPMLGILLTVGFGADTRFVLLGLSVIGGLGFILAYLLTNAIRADRADLEAVDAA